MIGRESGLMDDFIVLWLTTTDTDNTMCHRFKGIHRGRIAVELVHIASEPEHCSHVFVKGRPLTTVRLRRSGYCFFTVSAAL